MCIRCNKRLTIEHILTYLFGFYWPRESHFTAKSLRMLFTDISTEKIFNFLKETVGLVTSYHGDDPALRLLRRHYDAYSDQSLF